MTVSGNTSGAGGPNCGRGGDGGGVCLAGIATDGDHREHHQRQRDRRRGRQQHQQRRPRRRRRGDLDQRAAHPDEQHDRENVTGAGGSYTGPGVCLPGPAERPRGRGRAGAEDRDAHARDDRRQPDRPRWDVAVLPDGTRSQRGGINVGAGGDDDPVELDRRVEHGRLRRELLLEQGHRRARSQMAAATSSIPTTLYDDCPGIYADPKLGPLSSNGGPTQTMALLDGSGAIDIGAAAKCLAADQRGVSRPSGSRVRRRRVREGAGGGHRATDSGTSPGTTTAPRTPPRSLPAGGRRTPALRS